MKSTSQAPYPDLRQEEDEESAYGFFDQQPEFATALNSFASTWQLT